MGREAGSLLSAGWGEYPRVSESCPHPGAASVAGPPHEGEVTTRVEALALIPAEEAEHALEDLPA